MPTETKTKHVALLRGINVGGKNILPMKDLAGLFVKIGCEEVTTYIQSGNVIFRGERDLARHIPEAVSKAILKSFGLKVPVVVRTSGDLQRIVKGNPFLMAGVKSEVLHVGFLATVPGAKAADSLDPKRSLPDVFHLKGGEVYLHLPHGAARTRLTNQYFDSTLDTVCTIRNWNTVLKLFEMTR